MQFAKTLIVPLGAIGILGSAVPARATPVDFITAYGWRTTEAIVSSSTGASPGSLALSTCHNGAGACTEANADVTFTTSGVNFGGSGLTIAQWIATNTFPVNNLVDSVPGSLMDPTIWLFTGNGSFTGTAGTPQAFTIVHDDGATLIVNGQTVINQPGPTAPVTTTGSYTGGAGGSLPFALYYAECCGGPAVLSTSLLGPEAAPATVPEPMSMVLVGTGLLATGIRRRRQKR